MSQSFKHDPQLLCVDIYVKLIVVYKVLKQNEFMYLLSCHCVIDNSKLKAVKN